MIFMTKTQLIQVTHLVVVNDGLFTVTRSLPSCVIYGDATYRTVVTYEGSRSSSLFFSLNRRTVVCTIPPSVDRS